MNPRIGIIGGGISGLAVLHYIKRRFPQEVEVSLFERNPYVGGAIASLDTQGFLFETGPNGFLTNQPNTLEFLNEVGFADQIIEADVSSKRRYIQLAGKLHLLPMDPVNFIRTPLLSTVEKFRLIQGLFIKNLSKDQSVYDYTSKRFGVGVAERFVDPFLTGIYAGNIKRLHMQAAFPKLGSAKGKAKTKTKMCSFKLGMGSVIQHLFRKYKQNIKTDVEITGLNQINANITICCAPAYVTSKFLNIELLNQIPYSPVAVVGLVIKKDSFKNLPDGFGYLIPSTEGKDILGVLIESNVFKRVTDENLMFVRVMLGGAHHSEIVNMPTIDLVAKAIREIDLIYGLKEKPQGATCKVWPKAIPQYELNYPVIHQKINKYLENRPNLYLCANYLNGISFNDCIINAKTIVERLKF